MAGDTHRYPPSGADIGTGHAPVPIRGLRVLPENRPHGFERNHERARLVARGHERAWRPDAPARHPARPDRRNGRPAAHALDEVVAGAAKIEELPASGPLAVEGDQSKLGELLGLLDPPDPNFAIVTP